MPLTCAPKTSPDLCRFRQKNGGLMKARFTAEQIIEMIKEQETGEKTAGVCRRYGISTNANRSMVDLSRFCAAPDARLSHLSFECARAFPAQC